MEEKFKTISLREEDEKKQIDSNYYLPSPKKKEKKMIIPDFSPILIKETKFGFKTNGSYKKQKLEEPESPFKLVYKHYQASAKIQGRNLFGSKIDGSHRRKLNFDDEEEEDKNKKRKKDLPKFNNGFGFNLFDEPLLNNLNNEDSLIKQNKMENEYTILKTLKKSKLDFVYKVEEKNSKKIYCIKKIFKNSSKNNINNFLKLFNDMKNKIIYYNIFKDSSNNGNLRYDLCNHIKDYWIEDEYLDIAHSDLYIPEKYLYILYDYYPNGDLLDYLEKLERNNFKFNPNFYWDLIFEMIMGLKFFHELGYLHLDVKPANFLVDEKGYLKLADFGLCLKISDIPFLTDIIEGDKIYMSKELFNFNNKVLLNSKTDIYSLGLSILEIIAKINLPSYGDSWADLRSDNFEITENLFQNSNLSGNKDNFIKLISEMIAPYEKRIDINEILNNFEELNKRYKLLKNNNYKKYGEIPELNNDDNCNNIKCELFIID